MLGVVHGFSHFPIYFRAMLANSVTCGNRPIDRISGSQTAGPKVRKSTNKNNQRSENLVFGLLGLETTIDKNDKSSSFEATFLVLRLHYEIAKPYMICSDKC